MKKEYKKNKRNKKLEQIENKTKKARHTHAKTIRAGKMHIKQKRRPKRRNKKKKNDSWYYNTSMHTPVYHDCYNYTQIQYRKKQQKNPNRTYIRTHVNTHTFEPGNKGSRVLNIGFGICTSTTTTMQTFFYLELRDFMIEQCFILNLRISNRPQ